MIIDKLFRNKPRKFIGLLVVLAVLIMACPVGAVSTVVSIPDASAANCNTTTVPISIADVTNLATAEIWLWYDNTVVEVDSVADGDIALFLSSIQNGLGYTSMTWLIPLGVSGSLDMASVTLHAVGSGGDSCALHLDVKTIANSSAGAISHSVSDGTFTVSGGVVEHTLELSSSEGGEVTRPGEGTFTYDEGTRVNLRASPDACYEFEQWTGDPIDGITDPTPTITMNDDYDITAEFIPIPPYLEVDKSVSPATIGQEGSGLRPEETTVTLTVNGMCDPCELLTDIVVTDVLQSYINLEDEFTIEPDDITENADGTTTLEWYVGELDTSGEWTVSFEVSSDKCGRVLVDVVDDSKVTYNVGGDMEGFGKIVIGSEEMLFPATYLSVRCPGEVEVGVLPPEPAKIGASYLYISPQQIVPSQWVEISANIYNRGGTKATHTVALYINGYLAQSQAVGVSPGGTELVVFRVRADSEFLGGIYTGPGEYIANVEGMVGQFFVLAEQEIPPTAAGIGGPLGTGGIIAIVVVVIVLVCGLVFGLRRE
jgi:hypothetical protein